MKIRATYDYFHGSGKCDLDECERRYCRTHRMLWRDCETAKQTSDGDYANGRPHILYELGDCPECEKDSIRRRLFRRMKEMHPNHTLCPVCWTSFIRKEPDEVAIHLIDDHRWDYERARLFLRDEVEAAAFNNET